MNTRGTHDDSSELVELWARLERLKVGIGGWIVTGATMLPQDAAEQNVDGKIRELIDAAIEVKARIEELSTPPARHTRPAKPAQSARAEPPRQQASSPLSPVSGVPVVALPDLVVEPGSEVWAVLEQQTRDRVVRQRRNPAHRDDEQRSA